MFIFNGHFVTWPNCKFWKIRWSLNMFIWEATEVQSGHLYYSAGFSYHKSLISDHFPYRLFSSLLLVVSHFEDGGGGKSNDAYGTGNMYWFWVCIAEILSSQSFPFFTLPSVVLIKECGDNVVPAISRFYLDCTDFQLPKLQKIWMSKKKGYWKILAKLFCTYIWKRENIYSL